MTPARSATRDHLGAVAGAQLAGDPGQVALHGQRGQVQLGADVAVGPPAGDQAASTSTSRADRPSTPAVMLPPTGLADDAGGPRARPATWLTTKPRTPAASAARTENGSPSEARAMPRCQPGGPQLVEQGHAGAVGQRDLDDQQVTGRARRGYGRGPRRRWRPRRPQRLPAWRACGRRRRAALRRRSRPAPRTAGTGRHAGTPRCSTSALTRPPEPWTTPVPEVIGEQGPVPAAPRGPPDARMDHLWSRLAAVTDARAQSADAAARCGRSRRPR